MLENSLKCTLSMVFLDSCFEQNTDVRGESLNADSSDPDYGEGKGMRDSPSLCQQLCLDRGSDCKAFVWKPNKSCWLKKAYSKEIRINQVGTLSGKRVCDTGVITYSN